MRKLKLQVSMTIDGFVGGPNGELDWMVLPWSDDLNDYVGEITETVDTIVLGRKLAEGFIPYWTSVGEDPSNPDAEAGKLFTKLPKVVFTKTLRESSWENTVLAKNLARDINYLKNQPGEDIIAYGGANFVSGLIKNELIDEFHLLINPVAIGKGLPIFEGVKDRQNLVLIRSTSFDCGVVALKYELKRT